MVCIAALAVAMPAYAQATKTVAEGERRQAPAAEQAPVKKVDLPVPPPNFEYAAEGRRDPFVSLVNRGKDQSARTARRLRSVRTASPGCSPAS